MKVYIANLLDRTASPPTITMSAAATDSSYTAQRRLEVAYLASCEGILSEPELYWEEIVDGNSDDFILQHTEVEV